MILGGIALSVSGIIMLFPFSLADINGMQWAQYVHAVVGVILIAIMIAHIYIGSLGMEGAYDAMGSGEVDLAWARRTTASGSRSSRRRPQAAASPRAPRRPRRSRPATREDANRPAAPGGFVL